jgi:membrane protein YqaA with SNARE-associated domain
MNPDALVASSGLPLATFAYCVVAGLVPVVNAEIFLVAVAAMASRATLPWIVVMAALGQMVAKVALYLAGRGVVRLPVRRAAASLEAVRARVERWRSRDLLVLVSAVTGVPPFYAMSLLAGSLRFPLARFVALGLAGRLLRFAAIVELPAVGRWIVGSGP